ncbi:unnamed protein product [Cylicostephanus goldi]|uniref:Uncharacterized protein n=1 Tax=Cylicostephanus goldi TaxID=71465 RepID=A0A3P6RNA6_CYLGO|nr:unnamed protein product [Cylicostephanus goldi]
MGLKLRTRVRVPVSLVLSSMRGGDLGGGGQWCGSMRECGRRKSTGRGREDLCVCGSVSALRLICFATLR